jgi:hypothetical protein
MWFRAQIEQDSSAKAAKFEKIPSLQHVHCSSLLPIQFFKQNLPETNGVYNYMFF